VISSVKNVAILGCFIRESLLSARTSLNRLIRENWVGKLTAPVRRRSKTLMLFKTKSVLVELINGPDTDKSQRAFQAMVQMKNLIEAC
jgi:hypothetical protein